MGNFWSVLKAISFAALGSLFFSQKTEACSGAVPIGRGGTNVAVAEDASAVYWNPAGLTQLENPEIDITFSNGKYKQFLCSAQPIDKKSAWGWNFSHSKYDDVEFETENYWLGMTYAREFSTRFSAGATLVYNHSFHDSSISYPVSGSIPTEPISPSSFQTKDLSTSSEYAYESEFFDIDLGLMYKINENMKLGILMQDCFQTKRKINLRPGFSYKVNDKIMLAFEVYDALGNFEDTNGEMHRVLRSGLEMKINKHWSARAGLHGYSRQTLGASYRKRNYETSAAIVNNRGTLFYVIGLDKKIK